LALALPRKAEPKPISKIRIQTTQNKQITSTEKKEERIPESDSFQKQKKSRYYLSDKTLKAGH
jgi:hypothetical protein